MRLFKQTGLVILISLVLLHCTPKNKLAVKVSDIKVNFEIERFDSIFYNTSPDNFAQLKTDFGYLLPSATPDSIWLSEMENPDSRYLLAEAQKVFTDFKSETVTLTDLFKHVKYYFPNFKEPKVVTLISDVDYNNKVIYADSLLLVSLDMYLGATHEVYQNFPKYVKITYTKAHFPVDVAKAIAQKSIPRQKSRTFISSCIQQGKLLYAVQAFLPNISDSILMGYSQKQMNWAQINQESIWKYFIENEMIFKTDKSLVSRFLADAPFSKFYLESDNQTPGRIGAFIGFKIVASYINHTHLDLDKMLQTPNDIIFKQSKYKPRNNDK